MAAFVIVAAAAALLVSAGVHAQTGERVPGAYGGSRRRGTADDQQLWLCDEESEPLDYAAELGSRTAGRRVLTNRQTEGAGVSPRRRCRGYADRHADRDPGWPGGRLVGPLPTGRDRDEHGPRRGGRAPGRAVGSSSAPSPGRLSGAGRERPPGQPPRAASSAAVSDRGGVSRTTVATRRARAASTVGRSRAGAGSLTPSPRSSSRASPAPSTEPRHAAAGKRPCTGSEAALPAPAGDPRRPLGRVNVTADYQTLVN